MSGIVGKLLRLLQTCVPGFILGKMSGIHVRGLPLLGLQSRFWDKLKIIYLVCPQNRTVVIKWLTSRRHKHVIIVASLFLGSSAQNDPER